MEEQKQPAIPPVEQAGTSQDSLMLGMQSIDGTSSFQEPITLRFEDQPLNLVQSPQHYSRASVRLVNENGIFLGQTPNSPWFGNHVLRLSAPRVRSTIGIPSIEASTTSLPTASSVELTQLSFSSPMSEMRYTNDSKFQEPMTPIPDSLIQPAASVGVVEKQQYPRVSVVIPTRNEAENLPYVLPNIPLLVSEVILVDGHSTDGTVEVAQQLLPNIQVIKQIGRGKGDALKVGFAACTGDIIVMLDADGSANPNEIPRFVEALLGGNDFAKGSRFIKGGGSHDITILRSLGNYGLSNLVNMLFWTRFSDLCYGYNAFWRHCLNYVDIDCDGFEVETLINLRMHKANLKIVEVPSFEHRRIHGQSKLNTFRDGWRVLKTIVRERRRKASPVSRLSPVFDYALQEEKI